MIVVSDTSSLCYLVLIDLIDVLPSMYGKVIIPEAVRAELLSAKAPVPVRALVINQPAWLEVRSIKNIPYQTHY